MILRYRAAGFALAILAGSGLSACNTSGPGPIAAAAPAASFAPPASPAAAGPVLSSDGRCTSAAPGVASSIEVGIGECELVRLKGKPPTDVLVGESGKGQREVQVLYSEPGGRELYFFVDNRLDRIVK
jgi:hypothetical protein